MVEWSHALGGVPIYLHAADREWVMRADPAVQFWEGDTKTIGPNLTLIRLGGHFDGGTVLHWADWSEGRGVVLSGDILQGGSERPRQLYVVLLPRQFSNACSVAASDRAFLFWAQAATASRAETHSTAAASLIRVHRPILNVFGA
jgi:hypothetical protein